MELSHVKVLAPFQVEKWVRKARRKEAGLNDFLFRIPGAEGHRSAPPNCPTASGLL